MGVKKSSQKSSQDLFFCPRIVAVSHIILPPFEKNSITNTHTHNHTFIQTPCGNGKRVKKFLVMLVEPEAVVSKWFSSFKASFFITLPPLSLKSTQKYYFLVLI